MRIYAPIVVELTCFLQVFEVMCYFMRQLLSFGLSKLIGKQILPPFRQINYFETVTKLLQLFKTLDFELTVTRSTHDLNALFLKVLTIMTTVLNFRRLNFAKNRSVL